MSTKIWVLPVVCFLNFAFTTGVALADAPLRPGDQIEMKLGGVPSTEITAVSGIYTVDGDGSVNLPHLGRVNICGTDSRSGAVDHRERIQIAGHLHQSQRGDHHAGAIAFRQCRRTRQNAATCPVYSRLNDSEFY